jgi:hypothetical protein
MDLCILCMRMYAYVCVCVCVHMIKVVQRANEFVYFMCVYVCVYI